MRLWHSQSPLKMEHDIILEDLSDFWYGEWAECPAQIESGTETLAGAGVPGSFWNLHNEWWQTEIANLGFPYIFAFFLDIIDSEHKFGILVWPLEYG